MAKNPELTAVQQIVNALQSLNEAAQDRVLSSVLALLGKSIRSQESTRGGGEERERREQRGDHDQGSSRPKGLTELLSEKKPGTSAQRIALFAYYRDKHENNPRFGRSALEDYFGQARLDPPGNYDRDFSVAVEKGWIHENGDQSYITTSGIEVVEQGFEGERSYGRGAKKKKGGSNKRARASQARKSARKNRAKRG